MQVRSPPSTLETVTTFPEPASSADTTDLFARYLRFYREVIEGKLRGLSDDQLRAPVLESGWSPLELLTHLVHMERRWFVWGVVGEPVELPWGDNGPDGRWHVPDDETLESLLARLHEAGRRTEQILAGVSLDDDAALGGRFETDPPTVLWICFHVLQEYARHAGHLDAVREILDGATGEC